MKFKEYLDEAKKKKPVKKSKCCSGKVVFNNATGDSVCNICKNPVGKSGSYMAESGGNPKAGEVWKWSDGREFVVKHVGSGMGFKGRYIDVQFKDDKHEKGIKMTDFFKHAKLSEVVVLKQPTADLINQKVQGDPTLRRIGRKVNNYAKGDTGLGLARIMTFNMINDFTLEMGSAYEAGKKFNLESNLKKKKWDKVTEPLSDYFREYVTHIHGLIWSK